LRRSILACGLLLSFAGISTTVATASGRPTASTNQRPRGHALTATRAVAYWSRHVRTFRAGTRRWLTVIEGRPPQSSERSLAAHSVQSVPELRRLAQQWRRREHAAWRRANHPPDLAAWNCIHSYEGSWADPGAPYWGGLQMDLSFQASYGGWLLSHKGTADHWSPLEQIWTAVRAWRVRGFQPWAGTARACGLL
jgi:hypothetical protein